MLISFELVAAIRSFEHKIVDAIMQGTFVCNCIHMYNISTVYASKKIACEDKQSSHKQNTER